MPIYQGYLHWGMQSFQDGCFITIKITKIVTTYKSISIQKNDKKGNRNSTIKVYNKYTNNNNKCFLNSI